MPSPTKKPATNLNRGKNDRFRFFLTTIMVVLAGSTIAAFVTPLINESSWIRQSWGSSLMQSLIGESKAKDDKHPIHQQLLDMS